jgi:putative solute:sodium symporter small subunit
MLTDTLDSELRQQRALLAARAWHWRRTRRVSAVLLLLWLATSFGAVFFAREFARLTLFGWPLSFYLAAQGASLIYLAIIGAYAWRMRRLDRAFQRRLAQHA